MVLKCMKYPASRMSVQKKKTKTDKKKTVSHSWDVKMGSVKSLTFASAQERVIFRAHDALSVDPVGVIRRRLDHSANASLLKSALVQEG